MKKARLMALAIGLCMWGLDGGRSGLAQPRNPDGVAVIVGNRNYEHKDVFQVTYAHRDAEAFRRYVIDVLGFDERNVRLLLDAKRSDLLKVFGKPGNDRSRLWAWLTPKREWDVIIYYSGHGVPGLDDRKAYLLPTDVTPDSARDEGYPLELLYQKLGALENTKSVRVYLDACFSGGSNAGLLIRSASPVFKLPEAPEVPAKVTVLSAAKNSQVASWDRQAGHGLFTHHLLDALYGKGDTDRDGEVTADEAKAYLDAYMSRAALSLHDRTQDAVLSRGANSPVVLAAAPEGGFPDRPELKLVKVTGDDKVTGDEIEREGEEKGRTVGGVVSPRGHARSLEAQLDLGQRDRVMVQRGLESLGREVGVADGVLGKRTRAGLRWWQREKGLEETGYLTREQAEALMAMGRELEEKAKERAAREEAEREAARRRELEHRVGRVFRDCEGCPEMVVVPAGSFEMGSPSSEAERGDDEGPVHRVTIGDVFAVGVKEVTFVEWEVCVRGGGCGGYRPEDEGWGRGNRPVINVSWGDAKGYVEWLSRETGKEYRLLSEAEWEYVARAGSKTVYYWGDGIGRNRANCNDCGSRWDWKRTAPVGSFGRNGFGLHDVHGNVWEWVEDCWNDSYVGAPSDGSAWETGDCRRRVLRGGSWLIPPWLLRSAFRNWNTSGNRVSSNGFRVARTLTP